MNAAFANCFTATGAQLMLPHFGLSGWIGMQGSPMAPSCISLLLLGRRYPSTSAGCSPTTQGRALLSQPQPRQADKGPQLTPAGLGSWELYLDWGTWEWWRKGREGTMLTACPGKLFHPHFWGNRIQFCLHSWKALNRLQLCFFSIGFSLELDLRQMG